ncbi:unnamed protein product [Caenorhabditis bovis]|uniref:IGFBP N-terminal domain-containing protein n=1 Tax=Caenorhabditis bovis TaxID=2654633 RepID=A0A8S1EFP7_9PELO|nr:unnamed protein product [Caenorhabditis bovis]
MQQSILTVSLLAIIVSSTELSNETSIAPVVRRWKRHCGSQGCAPAVCQKCPSCCSMQPVFNINFNCCNSPRPNPSCCSAPAPPPPPPPAPCCGPAPLPQQPCCGPAPPAPLPAPVLCCKAAPVPENPCCQALAGPPPPAPVSPSCCAAAPAPANPCCQPVQPPPCTCNAPRPVPCRCAAVQQFADCPNCDAPQPRCSGYAAQCTYRRMRRDVHQQILQSFHATY